MIKGVKDERDYKNLKDRSVDWNGHTSQTGVLENDVGTSSFTSDLDQEYLGATSGPTKYEAQ